MRCILRLTVESSRPRFQNLKECELTDTFLMFAGRCKSLGWTVLGWLRRLIFRHLGALAFERFRVRQSKKIAQLRQEGFVICDRAG
jgi:hypothetical protein